MAEFTTVGTADAVGDGQVSKFEVGGKEISIANVGGSLHAFDDVCTHAQCSLADGDLEDNAIECPCHASRFDVTTGEVLNGPATDPLGTYPVRVEGSDLQIEA